MSTLENASAVLKLFAHESAALSRQGLSFSDVANRLPLPKSTLSRLLVAMEDQGLLVRDPANRLYSIGELLLAVGGNHRGKPLTELAAPAMAALSAELGCGGMICLLERGHVRILSVFDGGGRRSVLFRVGHRLPAAQTAVGRVLLAGYPERDVIDLVVPGAASHASFFTAWVNRFIGASYPGSPSGVGLCPQRNSARPERAGDVVDASAEK
ncbi:helix-turn-helix domain-containing protein [Acerihabitans sp. KWT182]|uniref:Helix-turn-helix domain-containing protein n=1 Tax=Acerihabitans sp. KWT182 TaxID=3157919 RepID=A0AAU7QD49_9GAMM